MTNQVKDLGNEVGCYERVSISCLAILATFVIKIEIDKGTWNYV